MWTCRSGASKCALASMTFSADCSASELGAPPVSSKKRRASQRRDRPGFAMSVDGEVGEAGAVRRVEQLGRSREFDQDVGLRRVAPARFAAFVGNCIVKR